MEKKDDFVTAPFRLAFPEVFKAKSYENEGTPKYSITLLFPKDGSALIPSLPNTNGIMAIRRLAFEAAQAKWGADKAKWPAVLRALDFKTYVSPTGKDGWPIRDGDLVEWDGFAGMYFVRASTTRAPGIIDGRKNHIIDPEQVFGGLICRATIDAFAYDGATSKGISFGLGNIQILRDDGTVYGGGRAKAEDVFDAFAMDVPPVEAYADANPW